MRATIATILATIALSLGNGIIYAQTQSADVPVLESIHMVDALTGWAMTDRTQSGALLRTTDGGAHWSIVTPRNSSRKETAVFEVNILNSLIAWVLPAETTPASSTQIFPTLDGGRTWRSLTVPARSGYSIHFVNSRDGWLLANEGPALGSEEVDVFRSTDGGETWAKVASAKLGDESSGLPFGGSKRGYHVSQCYDRLDHGSRSWTPLGVSLYDA